MWGCVSAKVRKREAKIKRLTTQLKSPERSFKRQAIRELGKMGPKALKAMPDLIKTAKRLSYRSFSTRRLLIWAMIQIGPEGVPYLIAGIMTSKPYHHRRMFYHIIYQIGYKATPHLLKALESKKYPRARRVAISALGARHDLKNDDIAVVRGMLKDESRVVRIATIITLRKLARARWRNKNPNLDAALEENIRALSVVARRASEKEQIYAIRALYSHKKQSKEVVKVLMELMKHSNPKIRERALGGLRYLTPDSIVALPLLIKIAKNGPLKMQYAALDVIEKLNKNATEAIPVLTDLLSHSNSKIRYSASRILGRMGPAAASAIPKMLEFFQKAPRYQANRIGRDLVRIGPRIIPGLLKIYKTASNNKQVLILRLFRWMGRHAEAALPTLKSAFISKNYRLSRIASSTLERLGPIAGPTALSVLQSATDRRLKRRALRVLSKTSQGLENALPVLLPMLRSGRKKRPDRTVIEAIGTIGPKAASAVPALSQILDTTRRFYVKKEVIRALVKINAPEGDKVLVKTLQTGNANIQRVVLLALQKTKSKNKGVLPQIGRLLTGEDSRLKRYALETLRGYGSEACVVFPELRNALQSAGRGIVSKVIRVMGQCKKKALPMMQKFIDIIQDKKDLDMMLASIETLGMLGTAAQKALPELRKMLNNPTPKRFWNRKLRTRAEDAIARIEGRPLPKRKTRRRYRRYRRR